MAPGRAIDYFRMEKIAKKGTKTAIMSHPTAKKWAGSQFGTFYALKVEAFEPHEFWWAMKSSWNAPPRRPKIPKNENPLILKRLASVLFLDIKEVI